MNNQKYYFEVRKEFFHSKIYERYTKEMFNQVVHKLDEACKQSNMDNAGDIAFHEFLAERGHPIPFKIQIANVCHAGCATKALCLRPELGLVSPCRLNIRECKDELRDGHSSGTTIAVMLPSSEAGLVIDLNNDPDIEILLNLVKITEKKLKNLVDILAGFDSS